MFLVNNPQGFSFHAYILIFKREDKDIRIVKQERSGVFDCKDLSRQHKNGQHPKRFSARCRDLFERLCLR